MAGRPPPSSVLPWAWVIEALANFKELDVTTLIELFNRSPKIPSHVGSNATEIACFRTLERLFDQDTQPINPVFSASNSRVSFDFSEQCEDVLRRMLGEMHQPDIWDESEKSKWDAQPFIAYKRSCLLKCGLQRLKDTLVEERPSYLTSLKQKVASLHLNQSGTSIHDVNAAILNKQQQSPCIDDKVCQGTSNDGNGKGECFDDVKLNCERSKRRGTLNGETEDDMDQSSDDDWYPKEMDDISAKKQAFFSSNCKDRQVANHWKEANQCMKCNKGGQLLVCSSDACSFVFHNSCLVSTSSFNYDSMGKFYCPFCRYSQSFLDYWVVKRKASLARNDLLCFSSSTLKNRPKRSHKRLCVSEQNATKEDEVVDEKNEASNKREDNNVIRVINTHCKDNTKGVERASHSRIYVTEDNGNVPCGEKEKTETNEELALLVYKQDLRNIDKECETKGIKGQLRMSRRIYEGHAEYLMPNGVPDPDLPNVSSESNGTEGCNEGSAEQADYVDRSIRFQKHIKPWSYLHVPRRRRVPVPWTQLEEETLKKWMKKFSGDSSIHDRGVPWRKILELEASVFQTSRKPGDLKDKWRNLQKASKDST